MRAYLVTTGTIFGLIAGLHLWRAIEEWPVFASEPWHYVVMFTLGVIAAALSVWAWWLLTLRARRT